MYRTENSNSLDITKSNCSDLGDLDALPVELLQVVEATNNVDRGNKELDKAVKNNSSYRTFTLFFLFVLIFLVLILDWYI
ncbi:hypothetical protein GIB67_030389 [Kingdonia uniflora]|uniref:t-SNARE coiled-coil homology domain-containing protein n=1 Tax=Kingdonia uniflora TaxID=39325 RepID=A0A7J7NX00_9MAGN|nr:hypothetical protein GIB67_030389 [Kingdonia uniflora]